MRKFHLLAAILILSAVTTFVSADTFKVDPVHSAVIFQIKHAHASNYYGRFNDTSGEFTFDADAAKCMFNFTVASKSIDTNNARRDDDVRGPDFLNAKQFPDITFKSTAVKKTGENTYQVTGDFTLKGVTKAITVDIARGDDGKGERGGFETTFTIKRMDYGVSKLPDMLGDEVKLLISFEGTKEG